MIRLKPIIVIAPLLVTACASAGNPEQSIRKDDAVIFEKFKGLAGTFQEVKGEGKPARIEYHLISRGSALTETWHMPAGDYGPNGKEELTVFHMDNGILVATHYCAANIQSTMKLDPESPPGTYNFILHSASNLASPDDSHNSAFGYTFEDENTLYRSEQWTTSGKNTISYLRMIRSAD